MPFEIALLQKVQTGFSGSRGSHDLDHTLRVHALAQRIGKIENANLEILSVAAYLHDIARKIQDESKGRICHAQKGAELSIKLLRSLNYSESKISEVAHCIRTHRYRGKLKPQSKEAKILFDADKLDSIGAVGIGRTFLYAGEIGAKLYNKSTNLNQTKQYTQEATAYREFALKLKFVKDRMLTKTGKRLAKERHDFMMLFFERMDIEIQGR